MSKRKKNQDSDDDDDDSSGEEEQPQQKPSTTKPKESTPDSDEESDAGGGADSDDDDEEEEKAKKKVPVKKKAPPKKRKTKKKKKDKNAPKKPATAYMFYSKEQRAVLQEKHKGIKFGELSKKISASWKELTDDEKKPYVRQHEEDKERYNTQMENYQEPSASESSSESESSDDEDSKKKKKPAKKKQKKEKDPNQPKPKTNAYMYFQKDQRDVIKKENPQLKSVPDIAKKIGAIWRSLSNEDKKPYLELAEKDKDRYDREMEEFKKKKSS